MATCWGRFSAPHRRMWHGSKWFCFWTWSTYLFPHVSSTRSITAAFDPTRWRRSRPSASSMSTRCATTWPPAAARRRRARPGAAATRRSEHRVRSGEVEPRPRRPRTRLFRSKATTACTSSNKGRPSLAVMNLGCSWLMLHECSIVYLLVWSCVCGCEALSTLQQYATSSYFLQPIYFHWDDFVVTSFRVLQVLTTATGSGLRYSQWRGEMAQSPPARGCGGESLGFTKVKPGEAVCWHTKNLLWQHMLCKDQLTLFGIWAEPLVDLGSWWIYRLKSCRAHPVFTVFASVKTQKSPTDCNGTGRV